MAFPLRHIESTESLYSDNSDDHAMLASIKQSSRPRPRSLHFKPAPESQQYQSEEEIPSPGLEDEEEDYSEFSSRSEAEASQDEVTIDPTIDLDHLEVLHSAPYETAKVITILCSGRAAEIWIGRSNGRRRGGVPGRSESPIQKVPVPRRSSRRRQRSISLYNPTLDVLGCAFSTPTQSSFDYSNNSRSSSTTRSRSPSATRSVTTNFSAPHRNPAAVRPRPGRAATNPSLSSIDSTGLAPPSLCRTPESPAESELPLDEEDEEGEALMRESLEVQVRTRSAERTRQMALSGADTGHYSDDDYEATPKLPPTTYDGYDPYALAPPQLTTNSSEEARRGGTTTKAVSQAARKWRGFARMGRRGRPAAAENAF